MQTRSLLRGFRPWLLCFVIAACSLAPGAGAETAAGQKQVLVLYATRRDAQIAVVGDRELPKALENGLHQNLDYYSEFIDRARFPQAEYQDGFRDFLRVKYEGKRFDLVIAVGEVPLAFVESSRETLFPDTPVVFYANSTSPRRPANATGVAADLDLAGTLDLIAALQPEVQRVFVVSGAAEGSNSLATAARAQLKRFQRRFEIVYLSALSTEVLETRLSSLPARSAVYYLVVDQDRTGANFHPLEYVDRVVAASNAPVYCWVDSALGHGIVGGSLKDQVAQTRALAAVAVRVLRGEPADRIPIQYPQLTFSRVDWRQLQRWGISEARVPAGTRVLFKEPSGWDRYRPYILGAIAALLVQTGLIAALLFQGRKRRRAEDQLRDKRIALQRSYERVRDLGGRLLSAHETERARIARELHDDVGQQLASLQIDLDLLRRDVPERCSGLADTVLDRAHDVARSVHDLSHRLHPAKLRLIGLVAALQGLQREHAQSGVTISVTHDNVPPVLAQDLTLCVFRVVQEALQNALKYGDAETVSVRLTGAPERLTLSIADDGVGFDVGAAWGKGLGLISMAERVEAFDGTFRIYSQPGAGTRIDITLPIQRLQSAAHAVSA
jgi:signal transduction histidine kinase